MQRERQGHRPGCAVCAQRGGQRAGRDHLYVRPAAGDAPARAGRRGQAVAATGTAAAGATGSRSGHPDAFGAAAAAGTAAAAAVSVARRGGGVVRRRWAGSKPVRGPPQLRQRQRHCLPHRRAPGGRPAGIGQRSGRYRIGRRRRVWRSRPRQRQRPPPLPAPGAIAVSGRPLGAERHGRDHCGAALAGGGGAGTGR